MMIRFLKPWRMKKIGDVFDWHNGSAEILIRRGIAIGVTSEKHPSSGGAKNARKCKADK